MNLEKGTFADPASTLIHINNVTIRAYINTWGVLTVGVGGSAGSDLLRDAGCNAPAPQFGDQAQGTVRLSANRFIRMSYAGIPFTIFFIQSQTERLLIHGFVNSQQQRGNLQTAVGEQEDFLTQRQKKHTIYSFRQ